MEKSNIDFWKKWDAKELNRQMTPIQWIVNKDKRETYSNHVKTLSHETKIARETVPCKIDIPYGDHTLQKLDIYGTDLSADTPVFFWIHGGYWMTGDKSWSGSSIKSAYSWGVKTVIIDYPKAPDVRLPEICNSVCQALQKAMNILPQSTFIIGGHSSGAQLAASIFHQIPFVQALPENLMKRVKGAFLIAGPYDMRPSAKMPTIQKTLQLKPDETHAFSSLLTVDKIHPWWIANKLRFFLVAAENDAPGVNIFCELYADMLRSKQFPVERWLAKDEDHFTIVENLALENSAVSKKLKEFLLTINNMTKKSKI